MTSLCRPPAPLGSDCENPHAILSGAGASRGRGRQWQPAPAPSGPALPGAPGNMLPPAHSAPIADPADPGARPSLPGAPGNMLHVAPSTPTWQPAPPPSGPHCQAKRATCCPQRIAPRLQTPPTPAPGPHCQAHRATCCTPHLAPRRGSRRPHPPAPHCQAKRATCCPQRIAPRLQTPPTPAPDPRCQAKRATCCTPHLAPRRGGGNPSPRTARRGDHGPRLGDRPRGRLLRGLSAAADGRPLATRTVRTPTASPSHHAESWPDRNLLARRVDCVEPSALSAATAPCLWITQDVTHTNAATVPLLDPLLELPCPPRSLLCPSTAHVASRPSSHRAFGSRRLPAFSARRCSWPCRPRPSRHTPPRAVNRRRRCRKAPSAPNLPGPKRSSRNRSQPPSRWHRRRPHPTSSPLLSPLRRSPSPVSRRRSTQHLSNRLPLHQSPRNRRRSSRRRSNATQSGLRSSRRRRSPSRHPAAQRQPIRRRHRHRRPPLRWPRLRWPRLRWPRLRWTETPRPGTRALQPQISTYPHSQSRPPSTLRGHGPAHPSPPPRHLPLRR
ncbi:hypothetical protein BJY21_002821 [Kineosphaera limosa]|nr:hypothetical protein [Kineosphaera limosa]